MEELTIRILRYDPSKLGSREYKTYRIPKRKGMKVLDALRYIYGTIDGTLSFRWDCRWGSCGECALSVNGKPTLACAEDVSDNMVVEPLRNFTVIKDLVVDRRGALERLSKVANGLLRPGWYKSDSEPESIDLETARFLIDQPDRCLNCLVCEAVCPAVAEDRWHTFCGPVTLLKLTRRACDPRDQGDRVNRAVFEGLYECLTCARCSALCPQEIDISSCIRNLRKKVTIGQPPSTYVANSAIMKNGNPFGQPFSQRSEWATGMNLSAKGDLLYFAGCYASYKYPQTARSTIEILKKTGTKVATLGNRETCCGIPLLWEGKEKEAENVIQQNVKEIEASGAQRLVTSCAGCFMAFKEEYPRIIGKIDVDVIHISQLVSDLVEKGQLALSKETRERITYHDPCHLGRYMKIYDAPRTILRAVQNVEFVEMTENRERSWCCGGGMTVSTSHPYLAKKVASRRISHAKEVGAKSIVTSCPLCRYNLDLAARSEGIKVYDLPDYVAGALKCGINKEQR